MTDERIYQGLLQPMRLLAVAVPPSLSIALGYDRPPELAARFVAFYWRATADEFLWDDGRHSSLASGSGWHSYTGHPTVALHFNTLLRRGLHFGGKGRTATHYFLLDLKARRAYAGTLTEVARLLALQHRGQAGPHRVGVGALDGSEPFGCDYPVSTPVAPSLHSLTLSQLLEAVGAVLNTRHPPEEQRRLPEVRELEGRLRTQRSRETEMVLWLDGYLQQMDKGTENETVREKQSEEDQ